MPLSAWGCVALVACTRPPPLGSQHTCPSLSARFGAVHPHPCSRRRLSPWKSWAFCFCFAREINSWQCQGSGRRPLGPETAGISGSVWTGCRPVRGEKEPGPPGQVRGAASRLQGSAVAVPCPPLPQLAPWPAPCARSPCQGPRAWRAKRPPNKVTLAPAPGRVACRSPGLGRGGKWLFGSAAGLLNVLDPLASPRSLWIAAPRPLQREAASRADGVR